jgi:lauroyl/myristoyl acyltransferase
VATQLDTLHPRAWALAVGAALALPVLLWPAAVLRVFGAAAAALFGDAGG